MTYKNSDKVRKLHVERAKQLREDILYILGGKCEICGFNDPRALQVDHIHANHKLKRDKYGRSGTGLYTKIINGELPLEDFQLLCANCNWIKRFENNENDTTLLRERRQEEVGLLDLLLHLESR